MTFREWLYNEAKAISQDKLRKFGYEPMISQNYDGYDVHFVFDPLDHSGLTPEDIKNDQPTMFYDQVKQDMEVVPKAIATLKSLGFPKAVRVPIIIVYGNRMYLRTKPMKKEGKGLEAQVFGDKDDPRQRWGIAAHYSPTLDNVIRVHRKPNQKPEWTIEVIVHEMSHALHWSLNAEQLYRIQKLAYENKDVLPSSYAATNPIEWVAEAITQWIFKESKDPNLRKIIIEIKKIIAETKTAPKSKRDPAEILSGIRMPSWVDKEKLITLKATNPVEYAKVKRMLARVEEIGRTPAIHSRDINPELFDKLAVEIKGLTANIRDIIERTPRQDIRKYAGTKEW